MNENSSKRRNIIFMMLWLLFIFFLICKFYTIELPLAKLISTYAVTSYFIVLWLEIIISICLLLYHYKRWFSFRNADILIGVLIGILLFVQTFGVRILDMSYTTWCGGDRGAHILAFNFFMDADWTFPFGYIQNYGYPSGVYIALVDAIPILSIPLKLISPLLPDFGQQLGLWYLICFILQGALSIILIRRFTDNLYIKTLFAILLCLSPIMIARGGGHTALMSHWIILLAVIFYLDKYTLFKKWIFKWSAIISMSIYIQPYFLPMVYTFFVASVCKNIFVYKKLRIRDGVVAFIFTTTALLLSMFSLGYFELGGAIEASGFGLFGMGLSALLDPQGWSRFLKDSGFVDIWQEGFMYLGLGIILLLLTCIIVFIDDNNKRRIMIAIKNNLFLLIFCALLTLFAFSNVIRYEGNILINIPLPPVVLTICNIFRSSARLFWPVYYLLLIAGVIYIIKKTNYRIALVLMVIVTLFQIYDMKDKRLEYLRSLAPADNGITAFSSPIWDKIGRTYKHVFYDCVGYYSFSAYYLPCFLAGQYNLTVNTGYFSRVYPEIDNLTELTIKDLSSGNYSKDTVYFIHDHATEFYISKFMSTDDSMKKLDYWSVFLPNWKLYYPEDNFMEKDILIANEKIVYPVKDLNIWGYYLDQTEMTQIDYNYTDVGLLMVGETHIYEPNSYIVKFYFKNINLEDLQNNIICDLYMFSDTAEAQSIAKREDISFHSEGEYLIMEVPFDIEADGEPIQKIQFHITSKGTRFSFVKIEVNLSLSNKQNNSMEFVEER